MPTETSVGLENKVANIAVSLTDIRTSVIIRINSERH
jgi:hypothetical protein